MKKLSDHCRESNAFEQKLKSIVLDGPFNGRDYQPRADSWLKYWERKDAQQKNN